MILEGQKTSPEVLAAAIELKANVAETLKISRLLSTEVPGWRTIAPSPEQLDKLVRLQILEALPEDTTPYFLPSDCWTRITVVEGLITMRNEDAGEVDRTIASIVDDEVCNGCAIILPGRRFSMVAERFPTQVLVLSWRRNASGVI